MTPSDEKPASGLATAVADLLAQPAAAESDQPELFDPADFEPDMPLPVSAAPRSGPKGGRPRGAQNKSTKQIRDYILSRYRHPLIGLAEMYSRTPEQLATELGLYKYTYFEGEEIAKHLDIGAAISLQQNAQIALLPYLAQKMPIEVEVSKKVHGVMLLGHFKAQQSGGGALPLAEEAVAGDQVKLIEGSPLGGDAS